MNVPAQRGQAGTAAEDGLPISLRPLSAAAATVSAWMPAALPGDAERTLASC